MSCDSMIINSFSYCYSESSIVDPNRFGLKFGELFLDIGEDGDLDLEGDCETDLDLDLELDLDIVLDLCP